MQIRIRILLLPVLLVSLVLGLTAGSASADVGPRWTDAEMVGFATLVVTGRVERLSTGRDAQTGAIYTFVTLGVDQVLKGWALDSQIEIKQAGGEFENMGLAVFDQAAFSVGEDVLVFLSVRPRDQSLYTTGLWQGKWTLERDPDGGGPVATRVDPAHGERGIFQTSLERRQQVSFMERVRGLAGPIAPEALQPLNYRPSRGLTLSAARSTPAAYTLFSPPWRWMQVDTKTAIPVDIGGSQVGVAGGGVNELITAFGKWSAVTPLTFVGGGGAGRCFGAGPSNGHISIAFNDPCNEVAAGGELAIGGASYFTSGGTNKTVNGVNFLQVADGYVVNGGSSSAQSFLSNTGCLASVETHEVGHVLGMGHSADPTAIMYSALAFKDCSGGAKPVVADDVAGIQFIYGAAGGAPAPTTAPGAPTGLTSSASGSSVTLTWAAPTSGGAPTAYIIEGGSSSGASNLANFSTGNTLTTFSATGVGAGSYFLRVKATNSAGTGPASNESLLAVGGGGGCAGAPGAPSGLTIVSNSGGTVTFSWGASSGSPSSYVIEAGSTAGASNLANSDLGGTATTFTATGVGKGTYFVRVKGKNACGTGAASNEVTLVVP